MPRELFAFVSVGCAREAGKGEIAHGHGDAAFDLCHDFAKGVVDSGFDQLIGDQRLFLIKSFAELDALHLEGAIDDDFHRASAGFASGSEALALVLELLGDLADIAKLLE